MTLLRRSFKCLILFLTLFSFLHADWPSPPAPVNISFSTPSNFPEVAVADSGNAVAVWLLGDDGFSHGAVQASSYSAASGLWSTPVIVTAPGDIAQPPKVAIDAIGNAFAIWNRFEDNTYSIQVSRYSFEKGIWSTPITLSSPGKEAFDSAIAVDAKGNTIAVWQLLDGTFIQASTYLATTQSWSAPKNISLDSGVSNPDVALSENGTAIAAWCQNGLTGQFIRVAFYSFATGQWSNSSNISSPTFSVYNPQVAINPSGNAVVAWNNLSSTEVFNQASIFSVKTGKWSAPFNLSAPHAFISKNPQVGIDAKGNVIAVWEEQRNDSDVLYIMARRYAIASKSWSGSNIISQYDFFCPIGLYSLAVNDKGDAVVAWGRILDENLHAVVQASNYLAVVDTWSQAEDLSFKISAELFNAFPSVGIDAKSNAIAVWSDFLTGTVQAAKTSSSSMCISGKQSTDKFLLQTEIFNTIKWCMSSASAVIKYNIYRNGKLIGSVPANAPLTYTDHNIKKGVVYVYKVIAISKLGERESAEITLP